MHEQLERLIQQLIRLNRRIDESPSENDDEGRRVWLFLHRRNADLNNQIAWHANELGISHEQVMFLKGKVEYNLDRE